MHLSGQAEYGCDHVRPQPAARAAAGQHQRAHRGVAFRHDLRHGVQRKGDALVDGPGDVPLVVIQREAHQTAPGVGIPIGGAPAHQRGQEHHALGAGLDLPGHVFHDGDVGGLPAAAQQVLEPPVEGRRTALHRAADVVIHAVHVHPVEDAGLGVQYGPIDQLGHPGAGADVAIGVARLGNPRAAGGAGPVAAADGHRGAGDQPCLAVDLPGHPAPHIVALQQSGHRVRVHLQRLQQIRGPGAFVDVQRAGQRGVGVVRVAPAASHAAVQIVLDVQIPAGPFVYIGLVLLQPQDLRQGVVRVRPVAGHAVEIVKADDVQNLLHLGFAATV